MERFSLEILHEAQSSMGPVTSLSGMICERWWELFPIPNSRRVKTSLDSADYDMRWKSEKVIFTFMGRGWEENFEYASGHLIISMYSYGGQTPDAGSWTWLGAEIWRPVPTSWESDPDCVTDPCQIDDVLSNKCHSHKAHLDPMNAATPVWKRKRYICSVWLCE